jgi:hypothetical protein
MESNLFVNLQGVTHECPREMSRRSLYNCVMFHLLTVFPVNAPEQEKYFITNVLKKQQRINVCQFVCQVEQLNTYIAQMLCFYYSPNANASTKPKNIPFMEADLGSHVLRMCLLAWQDQYNLNKKGMMPMDVHSLLTSLEAIEHVCTHKKAKLESSEFPRMSASRNIATCARSVGACIPCTTLMIVIGLRKMERRSPNSMPQRKAVRKQILLTKTSRS